MKCFVESVVNDDYFRFSILAFPDQNCQKEA